MITLDGLSKRYGETAVVSALSCAIAPGRVTGFLGPNGAGKSTTMRLIVGLDTPSAGSALIGGQPYARLRHPLREVGALLDARAGHPGRSARAHLRGLARSNGIPTGRVDLVLEAVGLSEVADRRVGTYSLGMGQRLGIAAALLGDPEVLLFDEPVNGLDPDGVAWVRRLTRSLAAEGRTVLVSSHLLSEMQETADHLLVIGRGRLLADAPVDEVIAASSGNAVLVRSPERDALGTVLADAGLTVRQASGADGLLVGGAACDTVGALAFRHGLPLRELSPRRASLEEAFLELTSGSAQFTTSETTDRTTPIPRER
ncbi:ABC-2 type transport system ATP-binding protein [Streptomyces zhaozhouensis]|uniref:ABC-2 type transport system ATP-binding protein n=1 Tax=Streptomyces zhaozhouensis TaxID=1300267 RepID=A0A286E0Q9_9ACTN|nr:ATP-binding cassette domain-containing protein [Streptomyces zhaozhouensis]SOD64465.1 ABC-2 type transport system ATP-binding protein [Streptomyces zhaozhouensis]